MVLTREDARAAGLPLEVLAYTASIDTANGRTRAAPVRLDRVAIGGLVERSVEALVAQPGQLKTSSLRHEFPQPAAKLGGSRRPAAVARLSVMEGATALQRQTRCTRKRSETSSRKPPNAISSVRRGSRCEHARRKARKNLRPVPSPPARSTRRSRAKAAAAAPREAGRQDMKPMAPAMAIGTATPDDVAIAGVSAAVKRQNDGGYCATADAHQRTAQPDADPDTAYGHRAGSSVPDFSGRQRRTA